MGLPLNPGVVTSSPSVASGSLPGRDTPAHYARCLLSELGLKDLDLPLNDLRPADQLWAESGAMWLSGHPAEAPRACPVPLASCAQGAWLAFASLSSRYIDPLFPAHRLLGERAAIVGLGRQGATSAGGACYLLQAEDGFLALNLAREDDRELLPAWLQQPLENDACFKSAVTQQQVAPLVRRARMMGLAAAPMVTPRINPHWFRGTRFAPPLSPQQRLPESPLVLDLTSLWAGPLCGSLLARAGARVIKVESTRRPDGARQGPEEFFNLLNAGKESVALDLSVEAGRAQLRSLIQRADIVLEAARPRGLEQMGIVAQDFLAAKPGMVWLSITGYGRRAPMRDWIAYGDDAGVAAGLSWLMGGQYNDPVFCSDAIADPLTGLHAALLALSSWLQGGGVLLDISLYDVVSHCIGAGHTSSLLDLSGKVPESYPVSRPQARTSSCVAAVMGDDTSRILNELQ